MRSAARERFAMGAMAALVEAVALTQHRRLQRELLAAESQDKETMAAQPLPRVEMDMAVAVDLVQSAMMGQVPPEAMAETEQRAALRDQVLLGLVVVEEVDRVHSARVALVEEATAQGSLQH